MNTLKILFTIMLTFLLYTAKGQITFQDKDFERRIIATGDLNDNDILEESEALQITSLDFYGFGPAGYFKDFCSMKGIGQLSNLETITLNGLRYVLDIDLSENKKLKSIIINDCKLTGMGPIDPSGPAGPGGNGFVANNLPLLEMFIAGDGSPIENRSDEPLLANCPKLIRVQAPGAEDIDVADSPLLKYFNGQLLIKDLIDFTTSPLLDTIIVADGLVGKLACNNHSSLRYLKAKINEYIDITGCSALEYLNLKGGHLTDLDLTGNINLKEIDIANNDLTNLTYDNLGQVTHFDCSRNEFSELSLNQLSELKYINCSHNKIVELDLGSNEKLDHINCEYNEIETISLEGLISLNNLEASYTMVR